MTKGKHNSGHNQEPAEREADKNAGAASKSDNMSFTERIDKTAGLDNPEQKSDNAKSSSSGGAAVDKSGPGPATIPYAEQIGIAETVAVKQESQASENEDRKSPAGDKDTATSSQAHEPESQAKNESEKNETSQDDKSTDGAEHKSPSTELKFSVEERLAKIGAMIDTLICRATDTRGSVKDKLEELKKDVKSKQEDGLKRSDAALEELKSALDKAWEDLNSAWAEIKEGSARAKQKLQDK